VGLHGWFFGLAGLITLAIVVLTVGMQSWKAAKANPILSLKSE
jgi:putative ABC transport system permease protein